MADDNLPKSKRDGLSGIREMLTGVPIIDNLFVTLSESDDPEERKRAGSEVEMLVRQLEEENRLLTVAKGAVKRISSL